MTLRVSTNIESLYEEIYRDEFHSEKGTIYFKINKIGKLFSLEDKVIHKLSKLHFTESQYADFVKNMREYIDVKMEDILAQKRSLQAKKNNKQHQIDALAQQYAGLGKDAPQAAKDRVKQQLNAKKIEMTRLDDELEINEKIVDSAKLKLTAENFLNLLNSLDLQMRAADMLQMDVLARKIFLNLKIDQQKTILYRHKEPFQSLVSGPNLGQVTFGDLGGSRTRVVGMKTRCTNRYTTRPLLYL